MESKVLASIRAYGMLRGGEHVICAVSGGADSMALLWCMWMLKEKLGITVAAAHYNHHLRMEESDRDAEFVRRFCAFHDIPLYLGEGNIVPGPKGLEAAARDARYAFLNGLDGVIATAHTADDNAETVLMHLIRGSGLRGLGGITPKSDRLIRPMLDVTRQEVEAYLAENWIGHIEDSSNGSDAFLRNRIRHGIMPRLKEENPSISESLSAMAQRLRQEEALLADLAEDMDAQDVAALRRAHPALRRRALEGLLRRCGLSEPGSSHIAQAENLVFSDKPSAFARFPGGAVLRRNYDRLEPGQEPVGLETVPIMPGQTLLLPGGLRVSCEAAREAVDTPTCFTVSPSGPMVLRSREPGDDLTRPGGTKSLKKRFIDRKIPAHARPAIPVVADEAGVLGVYGFGADTGRTPGEGLVRISFETMQERPLPPASKYGVTPEKLTTKNRKK